MLEPPTTRGSVSPAIQPCSTCGQKPAGRVEVGNGLNRGWLHCDACGKRTADGRTFEQAVVEWNALQA